MSDEQQRRRETDHEPMAVICYKLDRLGDDVRGIRTSLEDLAKQTREEMRRIEHDCAQRHSELISVKGDLEKTNQKLGFVSEKVDKHGKIFWWITTLVVGAVVIALLKGLQ